MTKVNITIITPVFNEEQAFQPYLETMIPILERASAEIAQNGRYEIIFVNDGSKDASLTVIKRLREINPNIEYISLSRCFGKEAALAAGLSYARGRVVIPLDIDLQDPPELIFDMLDYWKQGAKIVLGVRSNRDTDPPLRTYLVELYYRIYNMLSEVTIQPHISDFTLLDHEVVQVLTTLPERSRFTKGMLNWLGFPKKEVLYARKAREQGKSKWSFGKLWNLALDGIVSSTTLPLRIWTYIGGLVACIAVISGCIILLRTLFFGSPTLQYSLLTTLVLFFGGLQLFSLGIIGEYVARIAIETRDRPLFVVESTSLNAHANPLITGSKSDQV